MAKKDQLPGDAVHSEAYKLSSIVQYADAESTLEIAKLARYLDWFDVLDVYNEEALGKHLVENDSEYYASEPVKDYIEYEGLGQEFAQNNSGEFTGSGFIYINADTTLDYILDRDSSIGQHM